MNLFRYRPIKWAVKELEDGKWHYSSPEELNDPAEGYVKIYWQGDRRAWEGLFRNYVCSLYFSIENYQMAATTEQLKKFAVIHDLSAFDKAPMGNIFKELSDEFLSSEICQTIASIYGDNCLKCGYDEIRFILFMVHTTAFRLCIKHDAILDENMKKHMLEMMKGESRFPVTEINDLLMDDEKRGKLTKAYLAMLADGLEIQLLTLGFMDESFLYGKKNYSRQQRRDWLSIIADFPKLYAEQLADQIYPHSYFVCFSETGNSSAMWGNYADRHKGVCFIYDVEPTDRFKKVEYHGQAVEKNFFETFGRFTRPQIKQWLTGADCELSECFHAFDNEDEWRKSYWEADEKKNYQKQDDWESEKEWRIKIDDFLKGEEIERNIPYNRKSLIGIIFGINTSEYDKMQIVRAYGGHIGQYGEGFAFYQAEYDDQLHITYRKKEWKIKGIPKGEKKMEQRLEKHVDLLLERYPHLVSCRDDVIKAYDIIEASYTSGHKLLIAGNGGSAADSEHIVGELMKGFKNPRTLPADYQVALKSVNEEMGTILGKNLQGALPAIALDGHPALSTAYQNDVEPLLTFAQQVNGYGVAGDVFLGISTSGNSKNILYAAVVAKARGLKVIGLTGEKHSKLEELADVTVRVPQTETYMIQELHLPVYHAWCLMLEDKFFGE